MSFPSAIERPLHADEISIYIDNTNPVPLSALATFLGQIDKAARAVEGMDGRFLALSDFALGSNELRFKVVGPGRLKRDEIARHERTVVAAEKAASSAKVGAGASVVSAVAAVIALAIASGGANPSAYRITNQYNVRNVYVRAPDELPHVVTREDILHGRAERLSRASKSHRLLDAENWALEDAMHRGELINLAGWFYKGSGGRYFFETIRGNHLPVHFLQARQFEGSAVAVQSIVHDSAEGLQLEVVEVITQLADY